MTRSSSAAAPQGPPAAVVGPGHELPPRERRRALISWQWDRLRNGRAPNPAPSEVPRDAPDIVRPRAHPDALGATWIGHATVLLQVGGLNVLTDPIWSERASPLARIGPRRLAPPGLPLEALPPIDLVLISHDHYDHLDAPTVRALHEWFGDRLVWAAPIGYRRWFERLGVRGVLELGWWQSASVQTREGALGVRALPARHWSQRRPLGREHRSWGAWALTTPGGRSVFFGGDSGYFRGFGEIGRALGPFDLSILPIGAYDPRWFMAPAHMNPEEAVRAYLDLGGEGAFVGVHWATFRLTDEPPLEPAERVRAAWARAGLDPERLHAGALGRTAWVVPGKREGGG